MPLRILLLFLLGISLGLSADLAAEARAAMHKATAFYRAQVATEGGYHFYYAADLSYGRSESAEGPTQITVQRQGTPLVGMAYLRAWEATGDRYYLTAARDAALALVAGQLCSGGWHYIIEFDPAKRGRYAYRRNSSSGDSARRAFNVTTLDDNVTQAAVRLMMRVDRELGFENAPIHEAVEYALGKLIEAQYPNGAWPQRFREPPNPDDFPVKRASYPGTWPWKWPGAGYQQHYTFNDNTIPDLIDMFLEAARIYDEPRYLAAAERGGGFILLAQMPDLQPAWAQQYDREMHPAWARVFEPPAVTGGESQAVLRILLTLYRETGDRKYLEPVPRALAYLENSILPPSSSEVYRRASRDGGPVLARFYELRTNRPLYVTKGTQIRVKGRGGYRPDGYQLSYSDDSVITHYSVLVSGRGLPRLRSDYERIASADPATIRRPARLHGLSPWQQEESPPADEAAVRRLAASLDARGAWLESGYIGKADRIVSVFAARDMVVKVGEKILPLRENESVEVFDGKLPPRENIIRSSTFARNLEVLSRYLEQRP